MSRHEHWRRAQLAVYGTVLGTIAYVVAGLPLAFALMLVSRPAAVVVIGPALPAVFLSRQGVHPIAAVLVTVVAYFAVIYAALECAAWRSRTKRRGASGVQL